MNSPTYGLFCKQAGQAHDLRFKSPYSKFYAFRKSDRCFSCFKRGHPSFDCPEGPCEYVILCPDISATSRKTLNKKFVKMLNNGQIKNLEDNYDSLDMAPGPGRPGPKFRLGPK
ncbi:unnamed protein product [Bursaphelenchus xylophilus]|uniref:(pine wood nematode) hypothetical protein n=1 Tax=Bursaphelenchus xylophilus TaxID=6326 RepID=A0A1I7S2R1_BURXY|nr:unnamed protein product [Bursaphelenchus xylophilus]CAG9121707.1 unnamed protein product [Bursaphelenchus xylophilus]